MTKGKEILNRKELDEWIGKNMAANYDMRARKGFVDDVFYSDGSPVDNMVNIGWHCPQTDEYFEINWGYEGITAKMLKDWEADDEFSYEHMHGKYTIYFGASNFRHGYNILGRINEKEVDDTMLQFLIRNANLGLKNNNK